MRIDRNIGHAPRVEAIGQKLMESPMRCVDCTECKGLCQELIEVLVLPDMVLKGRDG
ncbi:hypothetical protein [Shimia aestuarii]|uniref:Uncharacterized protein n=1 Tax=Shimia aestuarii TaxID=254406 RepID=A0A1I4JR96_9RHOB|nr:hypothetical protein [Shimia aestuarii]SFL68753.1 hypothetical protein SAMN04488042_1011124 [Shimia aestuarii]